MSRITEKLLEARNNINNFIVKESANDAIEIDPNWQEENNVLSETNNTECEDDNYNLSL